VIASYYGSREGGRRGQLKLKQTRRGKGFAHFGESTRFEHFDKRSDWIGLLTNRHSYQFTFIAILSFQSELSDMKSLNPLNQAVSSASTTEGEGREKEERTREAYSRSYSFSSSKDSRRSRRVARVT